MAEDSGLIIGLGERVLRMACQYWSERRRAGHPPLTLAVNLSSRQVALPGVAQRILTILEETDMDPSWLELELTESVLLEHEEGLKQLMRTLTERGVRLAIDDFGTGYSSLSYLKNLAVDRLKIDSTFVRDLPEDKDDAEITAAVIAMAHNLRLVVSAEGVENEAQLAFLARHGCDAWQGYLGSPPLAPEQLEDLITTKRVHHGPKPSGAGDDLAGQTG
ncbi:EAL domain-containing protein [Arhodomonas sp. SL1]|uniref:EAL domain-containing protein n=1 Tax=Arhodomonas sp. SL1 TaxID=3425691 RepID=UPI003F881220